MKKIFFLSLVALAFASCSNDEDAVPQNKQDVKLVNATISAKMYTADAATRAYLGVLDNSQGTEAHIFEKNDVLALYDKAGKHTFTCTEGGQSSTLTGQWAEPEEGSTENGVAAIYPLSAVKSISNTSSGLVMNLTLPTNQTTATADENAYVTYDRTAGISFACSETKGTNIEFIPVVSYLYFYSTSQTCTITSKNNNIAGNFTVTYKGEHGTGTTYTGYSTVADLQDKFEYAASAKEIKCTGVHVDGHKNKLLGSELPAGTYEYMICIKPGTYSAEDLEIIPTGSTKTTNFTNKSAFEANSSHMYYLGCID